MNLVLFLIISNAIICILIGYNAAVLLQKGHPDGKETFWLIVRATVPESTIKFVSESIAYRLPFFDVLRWLKLQPQDTYVAKTTAELPAETTPTEDEGLEQIMEKFTSANVGDLLESFEEDLSFMIPEQEVFDEEVAELLGEQTTESWLVNDKQVETSLLRLNTVMMKSGRFAAELDWRIRSLRGSFEMDDIEQFVTELQDDCKNYLETQSIISQQMVERLDEFGELRHLAEEVDYANMEQSAQVETTLNNLNLIRQLQSPEDAANKLLRELASLRVARHKLRDLQDKTYINVVLYENRTDTVPQQLFIDEQLGIRSRIGLEMAIHNWWQQKRHQTRQFIFVLLDFVRFGEINDEYGIKPADNILKLYGQSIEKKFDKSDIVGIYCGNCYLVVTQNVGLQKTITEIERLRQHCEQTRFVCKNINKEFQLQLTCGIAEALGTQNQSEVLQCLEKTLHAAKKAGKNCTFNYVHGPLNKPPEQVVAPNLVDKDDNPELIID
ncbi:MAG: diguanylate cyclase [Planctomycetaceae bacterium]|jgi:diguanylate cyclase (GGDEF)-like protein|nr:diguanylate cyclase [Planctomycetaceae bacterium]